MARPIAARLLASSVLLALAVSGPASAQQSFARVSEPSRSSVGLMFGGPTGLALKQWLGGSNAIDLGLGFALAPGLRVHADYLWGLARLPSDGTQVAVNLYLGVGPMLGVFRGPCGWVEGSRCGNGLVYAGVRVPFGIEANFRRTPFSLGVELAPGFAATSAGPGGTFDLFVVARLLL